MAVGETLTILGGNSLCDALDPLIGKGSAGGTDLR